MEGIHRIVLTPTGWLHEQNNWKRVAGDAASSSSDDVVRFVAAEIGLDRYERITAPSLTAADAYWKKTGDYWAIVRRWWGEEFAKCERFKLRAEVGGQALFESHFAYVDQLESGTPFDAVDAERHVRATLTAFLAPASAALP